jgi:hypothetical protein
MAYIILDADSWQNVTDFETGEPIEKWDNPDVDAASKILASGRYPGDIAAESIEWTTQTAKKLDAYSHPDLMALTFATPYFMKAMTELTPEQEENINNRLFAAVDDFLAGTDYQPMIIGLGGMTKVLGTLETPGLMNRLRGGLCPAPYIGLFNATAEEIRQCHKIPHVAIHARDRIFEDFPLMNPRQVAETPDLILMADDGYTLTSTKKRGFLLRKVPYVSRRLPVHTTLPVPPHITGVRKTVEEALDAGKRVALILLEGTGEENFRIPFAHTSCEEKWMVYDQGALQYMAIFTGKRFYENNFSLVLRIKPANEYSTKYPYSQFEYIDDMPVDTLGRKAGKKTAAVGSRSMFTHAITQADICIECQARATAPSGLLALINDPK